MNRKFGIGILIFSFSLSSINLGWAAEGMEISPIVVQPGEIQSLNQQMIDRDRQNRDEEIDIKQLADQNNQLAQNSPGAGPDASVSKINQTMLNYRAAIDARDRARILENDNRWWTSRYGDLIKLTEDADDITVHQELLNKNSLLIQKFELLESLKNEMLALNDRLKTRGTEAYNQKEIIVQGYQKVAHQQQDKIQLLVARLNEMDQKISHFDEIIAQKDQQIANLKDNLANADDQIAVLKAQSQELKFKEEDIKSQADQLEKLSGEVQNQNNVPNNAGADIQTIQNKLQQLTEQLKTKDELIKTQADQLETLSEQTKNQGTTAISTPVVMTTIQDQIQQQTKELKTKDDLITQMKDQVDLLKSELEDKITEINNLGPKDAVIKEQGAEYAYVKNQVMTLRDTMKSQSLDLKAKDESIQWLNQVLAVTKNKAKYYQLTSQQANLSMQQVQGEVQNIKDDFAQHFKNYDQFENSIISLKSQVDRLSMQLNQRNQMHKADMRSSRQKDKQLNLLRAEILNIITQDNIHGQQEAQIEQDLKDQVQDKAQQIIKMKADILAILQDQANKEIYRRNASAKMDDRINLAKQLIDLQEQEASLIEEKNRLRVAQNVLFEQHVLDLEIKIKGLLAHHQIQMVDLQDRMEELQNELSQKDQQVELLNTELKNKISEQRNQSMLIQQIQDLNNQLQDKEGQITTMKQQIQDGQKSAEELDSLKQDLAAQQDKADQLKQQLDIKTAQSDQTSAMMGDYQKKLESKDNANNEQLGQILTLKNYQAQMEKQIDYLSSQVQEKEAQVVKIKRNMYDLQQLSDAKDRDTQAKDLSLAMIQQKTMDDKINEYQDKINGLQATNDNQSKEVNSLKTDLALVREELEGMPSSDEIEFLRSGLKKTTVELKQKDEMLAQIKANAQEYAKAFKDQSQEFQTVKEQLQEAYDDINHKDEELKNKDLEVVRLKEQLTVREADWEKRMEELQNELLQKKQQVSVLIAPTELQEKEAEIVRIQNDMKDLQETAKNKKIELQNLQDQLQDAQDEIGRKNEDLKYKDMAITRLKELTRMNGSGLEKQVMLLTQKLEAAEKRSIRKSGDGKVDALQAQLDDANLQIKNLKAQLDQFILPSKTDPLREKLKQALDKIDQQGHVINMLTQKLEETQGQTPEDYLQK